MPPLTLKNIRTKGPPGLQADPGQTKMSDESELRLNWGSRGRVAVASYDPEAQANSPNGQPELRADSDEGRLGNWNSRGGETPSYSRSRKTCHVTASKLTPRHVGTARRDHAITRVLPRLIPSRRERGMDH